MQRHERLPGSQASAFHVPLGVDDVDLGAIEVAEIFTGTPGAFVDLETTINDFEEAPFAPSGCSDGSWRGDLEGRDP